MLGRTHARHDASTVTIKGHLESHIGDSDLTSNALNHRHFPEERKLASMVFYHHGQRICRKTYLFLHNIGKKRYSNLKASVITDGVLPRRHGNLRRVPHHAFSLEDTLAVNTFITNYTEEHGFTFSNWISASSKPISSCSHVTLPKKLFAVMRFPVCHPINLQGRQDTVHFFSTGKTNSPMLSLESR